MSRLKKVSGKLNVVYSDQPFPTSVVRSLFLAGPTPRSNEVESWRKEALSVLESMGYDGTVFVPEPSNGQFSHSYDDQVGWELTALSRADIIVFWVPRELDTMPAFTTNVEFGYWLKSGKVVFGFPDDAEKMRYLEYLGKVNDIQPFNTLEATLKEAVNRLGDGAARTGGEVEIPLLVWSTPSFQNWYKAQTGAGNRLDHAEVRWVHLTGPKKDFVFMWIVQVDVFVASENRHKTNEFVVSRTDTSSVVMYSKSENLLDTKVVLVREFRSPASTQDGFIWEVPGGSSFKPDEQAEVVAAHEVEEETGLKLDPSRIQYEGVRQGSGTLLANKIHMFSVELTDDEMTKLAAQTEPKGNIEDTEITYVEVLTVDELLQKELVDWSNVGMILSVLNKQNETNR